MSICAITRDKSFTYKKVFLECVTIFTCNVGGLGGLSIQFWIEGNITINLHPGTPPLIQYPHLESTDPNPGNIPVCTTENRYTPIFLCRQMFGLSPGMVL